MEESKRYKKLYSIGEASDYLGISIDTIRRWVEKGKLETYRSPGGHRYFKRNDLDSVFGRKYERALETKPRKRISKPEVIEETAYSILDRPVREINVPSIPAVKVARENVATNSSILTPLMEDQPVIQPIQPPSYGESQKITIDQKTKLIIFSIVIFTILVFVFYFIWRSSQTVLSPIP